MGVHGLWELLAPVGRRVSVETLAGKKLAIDASIWMIQFMKAMRDEKGEMVRNAHILGFFRRICKLLYLRTKPVFVFDGGTPALKRRTVIARRRQRENAQAKIRKTAEKLLLNHLKAMRLKELAADLEKQRQENDIKGKRPITQEANDVQQTNKGNDDVGISYSQEELDAMLAASLAVEENDGLNVDASISGGGDPADEVFGDEEDDEDDDEDEEMILPEMQGKVDPAVLAALPPSMQLDLLVQMRERLMAENRQKYQKVKKAPARFSELQIQAYLKTVAFRREIDGVQKSAAGRGIGGVQTSRIASEANREFIFSSSFTGDKQALASVGQERVEADQSQAPPADCTTNAVTAVSEVRSSKRSSGAAGPTVSETGKSFHDDVETYLDERGRLRVSRVRALGIRMTRDLQRNLDLMKEIDQEKADTNQEINNESTLGRNPVDVLDNLSDRIEHREVMNINNAGKNDEVDITMEPAVVNGTSIEVSFEDTLHHEYDNDDEKLFARLVAGDPIMDFSVNNSASVKQSLHSNSDCEWEEGDNEDKSIAEGGVSDDGEVDWEEGFQATQLKPSSCPDEIQIAVTEGALQEEADFEEAIRRSLEDTRDNRSMNDEDEVEWEEGFQDIQLKPSLCPGESQKAVTKGALQEEANFQEAIRRSLEDARYNTSKNDSREDHMPERARVMVSEDAAGMPVYEGKEWPEVEVRATDVSQTFGSTNILETNCSVANSDTFIALIPEKSNVNLLNESSGGSGALAGEIPVASDALPDGKGLCMTGKQPRDAASEDGSACAVSKKLVGTSGREETLDDHSCRTAKLGKLSPGDSMTDEDGAKELAKEKISGNFAMEKEEPTNNSSFVVEDDSREHEITEDHVEKESLDKVREELGSEQQKLERNAESVRSEMFTECQVDDKEHEIMESHLEEEMRSLDKVREELGNEQRKLERNAESVSSEMFTECQELLQMFGLPYIIAPMEAEAQCAFMELSNLVDGVVTDDSDAFLFGARSVYKNIFDDRKYVETYLMKDIEDELGLDREKLIHMALLLGSDYTEGISGIGIVNAIEVVNAFPEKYGLREFREWIESPDPTILGKLDVDAGGNSRRKGSKDSENTSGSSSNAEGISGDQNVTQPVDDAKRKRQIFMDKHRNVSKNWHIPSTFPSDAVISAYASPQVDKSTEPFSWGKPDLFVLRKLCWEKFGWNTSKADDLLLPVLKEYSKHETQLRLEAFYTFNERFAKIRSKRIKKAVKGITANKSSELMDETTTQHPGSGRKRKLKPSEDEANQSGVGSPRLEDSGTSNQNNKKPAAKRVKRGLTKDETSQADLEQSTSADSHMMIRKESCVRGRNRGRGRVRGQVSARGKRKKNSSSADTETSNDDGSFRESDEEMQFDRSEESHQVRRSGRLRKTVSYTVSDEFDDYDKENDNYPKEDPTTKDSVSDQEDCDVNKTVNELNEGGDVEMGDELLLDKTKQEHGMDTMCPKQIDDAINRSQLSQDYLQLGGGFCLDEDEEKEFEGHASSSHTTETTPDKPNLLNSAASVVEENRETDLFDTENDVGNSYSRSLRAMPNLRKKRRKT